MFSCNSCNYATHDKSNYNKHIKSIKHVKKCHTAGKSGCLVVPTTPHDSQNYQVNICNYCKRDFARSSGLTKHMNTCAVKAKEKELEIAKIKLDYANKQIEDLKNYMKTSKPTYNISVKNYVQLNYPDAIPLAPLNDYSLIEDENTKLIDNLVYHYNHSLLAKYLGDFLVKHYKKEDQTQQSLWNSDVARMTYIIKELMANKKSLWNHDYKGVKTKEFIIMPLLKYVQDCIKEYLMNYMMHLDRLSIKECEKIAEKQLILGKILQYINTDLAEDIVKSIAPHFKLNNTFIENNIDNDQLIDKFVIDCD